MDETVKKSVSASVGAVITSFVVRAARDHACTAVRH
jgi:hypothetical protein